jgi:hypothetical protein
LERRRRRGLHSRDLSQRAQVGIQNVNRPKGQRHSAIPLVQRHDQFLNTPQLNATVGKVAQNKVKLIVRNVDHL